MKIGAKVKIISKSGYLSIGESFFVAEISGKKIGLKSNSNTLSARLTIAGDIKPKTGKDMPLGMTKFYSADEFKEKFVIV